MGQPQGRSILADIAGFQLRDGEFIPAFCQQRRHILLGEQLALAQPPSRQLHGMRKDMTLRLFGGDHTEFHPLRSTCVICASTATAISDGPAAPISSPMGPWMRAMSSSVMPSAFIRSTRLAWVRVEPSAPM